MTSFHKILQMCDQCKKKPLFVKLEARPKKYMFGLNHYGDIPSTLNKADGDPWDVLVPGYNNLPIGEKIKMKRILGVLLLGNGNHKLIVDVHSNEKRNCNQASKEIKNYQKRYAAHTKLSPRIIIFKASPN